MDVDGLERLLMDRALGGLSPDVEALLTAYLAPNTDAAARGREFDAAASAARHVLRGAETPTLLGRGQGEGRLSLPAFPAAQIRSLERTRRQLLVVRNVASLAAAVIVGVGLGVAFFRGPATATKTIRPPVTFASTAGHATPHGEFWSAQRLYEQSRRTKHPDSTRLIWDSAISAPRLGEEL